MERTRVAFDVVRQAFDLAMATIRPGVAAGEVDRVCRDFIAASPFGGTHASPCG